MTYISNIFSFQLVSKSENRVFHGNLRHLFFYSKKSPVAWEINRIIVSIWKENNPVSIDSIHLCVFYELKKVFIHWKIFKVKTWKNFEKCKQTTFVTLKSMAARTGGNRDYPWTRWRIFPWITLFCLLSIAGAMYCVHCICLILIIDFDKDPKN